MEDVNHMIEGISPPVDISYIYYMYSIESLPYSCTSMRDLRQTTR